MECQAKIHHEMYMYQFIIQHNLFVKVKHRHILGGSSFYHSKTIQKIHSIQVEYKHAQSSIFVRKMMEKIIF